MFVAEPLPDARTEGDAVRAALELLLAGGRGCVISLPLHSRVLASKLLPGATARRIERFECRPSPYGSSCALSEIDATLEDGTLLRLIRKELESNGRVASRPVPRPAFLQHPLREIEVYRRLLGPARSLDRQHLGTAEFHGAAVDPASGRTWLFLERVSGCDLSLVGDFALWRQAARWLADFHARFRQIPERSVSQWLLKHDADLHRVWIERAVAFQRRANPCDSSAWKRLERLAANYERVIEQLASFPRGLIHGEFYASNVLVENTPSGVRVCPVDWETAGIGPLALDVAALVAGAWPMRHRRALCLEYFQVARCSELIDQSEEAFLRSVDVCRLQQAVQWLGWSEDWMAPPRQRQDWLGEALELAERLEILE